MKILVCGSCMPQQFEYRIKDLAAASNQYHLNMIHALESFAEVKVLSYIGMNLNGVPEREIEGVCADNHITCIFKQGNPIGAYVKYQHEMKKMINWADVIITYNVQFVWFGVGRLAKRNKKKAVLVWADHTPVSDKKNIIGKVYSVLSEYNARQYQKVVALSPNMRRYLLPKQEYVVSHGCVDWNQFKSFKYKKPNKPLTFMFSGLLAPVTGADLLLGALKKIRRDDVRVVVTGKGPLDNQFRSLNDDRVDYKGFVSREEYRLLLDNADVLLNPRNMNMAENQNNFPSKVLEYLATGKPIISTRFSGWNEYKDCCQYIDSTVEALVSAIENFKYGDISLDAFTSNRDKAKEHLWTNEIRKFI